MFTSIIESILMKHIGKYLSGVEKNSFDVGLLDGDVVIENVGLNNKLFEELSLPITLKFSNIDKLLIQVPWTKLDKERAVALVTGLNVLITMEDIASNSESTGVAYKFNKVITWLREQLKKKESKDQKELSLQQDNLSTKMLLRIIDNIEINIHNIHIRLEDTKTFQSQNFSLGFLIDSINTFTVDEHRNKHFYVRSFSKKKKNEPMVKSVVVSPVKAYWNPKQTMFIKEAVDRGLSKQEIVWLMRAPFPQMRQMMPHIAQVSTPTSEKEIVSSTSIQMEKPEKTQKQKKSKESNFFTELFKPRSKTHTAKKQPEGKQKTPEKPSPKIQTKKSLPSPFKPIQEWQFQFKTICTIGLSAQLQMNDLKDKQTPLLQIGVSIDSMQIHSNQFVLGQLFLILQHFLKYVRDIYFFENRSLICNTSLEEKNKEIFNTTIENILKSNKKVKKYDDLHPEHWKTAEEKELFIKVLEGYSIKKLEGFAEGFMFEWKLRKQIEKAHKGHKKDKEKAEKEMKKFIEKLQNSSKRQQQKDQDQQIKLTSTNRPIFQLKVTMAQSNLTVDYIKQELSIDSLNLIIRGCYCQLRFVKIDQLDLLLKVQDLVINYTNSNGVVVPLNKNIMEKEETLVNLVVSRRLKEIDITGEVQRKVLFVSEEIVGFVVHFFEDLRVGPFMLNLLVEKAQINIDKVNILLKLLLESIKHTKCQIRFYLPVLDIQMKQFGLLVDGGVITLRMPDKEGITLKLTSVHFTLSQGPHTYPLLSDISMQTTLQRRVKDFKSEDLITVVIDRLTLNSPPIHTIDLLAVDIKELVEKILTVFRKLITREKKLLSRRVKYNNHMLEMEMYVHGEMLEFVETASGRAYTVSLFKARVYPLVHSSKHYLVIAKQSNIQYVQLLAPSDITHSTLNDHIDHLSTQQQLNYFWMQSDKYEQAVTQQNLTHNHHNLLLFIENTQRSSKENTSKLYELHFLLKECEAKLNDLLVQVKRTQLRSIRLTHTREIQLFVSRVAVGFGSLVLLEMSGDAADFMHLKYQKVVSETCDIRMENMVVNLSERLMTPVLDLLHRLLSMRIIEESKRKSLTVEPAQLEAHRLFNLRQRQLSLSLSHLRCDFFTAETTMESITGKIIQQTNHIDFKLTAQQTDICECVKIPTLEVVARVSQVEGTNLEVKIEEMVVQVNPVLFEKYLGVVKVGAQEVLSNLKHLHQIQTQIQKLNIYHQFKTQAEMRVRLQNTQLQIVLNENNALLLCFDEAHLRWELIPPRPGYYYTFSLMRFHIERIHQLDSEQMQFTVLKPISFNAKGEITAEEVQQAHMALTKIELEINFQFLEFVFMVFQKYIVVYGQNPWLGGFLKELAEIEFEKKPRNRRRMSEINTQIDQISFIYLHDSGAPLLKTTIRLPSQSISITPTKSQLQLQVSFETSHFNTHFKMYEPLVQTTNAEVLLKSTASRNASIESFEFNLKTMRVNVSKDFIKDGVHLIDKFRNYFTENRNRLLEVKFYIEQILENKGRVVTAESQSPTTTESMKQKILIESMRLNTVVLKQQSSKYQKHSKNFVRICNNLGIDVTCSLNYIYSEQPRPPFTIPTSQSHTLPMSIQCDYTENYQVLERLRKMSFAITIHDQQVFNRTVNLATFLSERLEIPPKQNRPGVSIYLKSELSEDQYVITFTTAKRVENMTGQELVLGFKEEGGLDCKLEVANGASVFMPYFVNSTFYISIKDSKQLFLLNFSKAQTAQEIELPGPDQEKHYIIMHSRQESGIEVVSLLTALQIMNHFNVYISLTIDKNTRIIEPGKVFKTTAMSLHQGLHMIGFSIPLQTEQAFITIDSPQKLMKERQLSCHLIDHQQTKIMAHLLLSGEPHCRYLQIYPRMSFINETTQKLFIFTALYGGIFPVEKAIKDNAEDYEKLSMVIVENAVRMRFRPLRTCYVLDNERYLHVGLRNCRKGMSEELVAYQSDFRKTIWAEEENLTYYYSVKYQQTKINEQISTFKTRLLPKFYLINRTDYTLLLFQNTKVPPNEMIVLPFPKDGLFLMSLQSKDSKTFHQLTPVRLSENQQIKYLTKFNFGFINPQNFPEEVKEINENLVVKMELQLVFHDSLGYYILNRKSKQLVLRNKVEGYRIVVRDVQGEGLAVMYQLGCGAENDLFPIFGQNMKLQICEEKGEIVYDKEVDFSKPLDLDESLQELPIVVKEHYENSLRIIEFRSLQEENQAQEVSQQSITSMGKLSVETIILSAILDDFSLKRKEILHLHVDKTCLTMLNYQTMKIIQAKISNLILGTNETHGSPCILRKRMHKVDKDVDFVTLFMQTIPSQNLVQNFKMQFCPLSVYMTQQLLELLIRNSTSFLSLPATISLPSVPAPTTYTRTFNEFYQMYSKKRQNNSQSSKNTIKLINLTISSIQLQLTFKQVHFQGSKQFMKSFGLSFVDIDKARLSLSELKIRDAEQSQDAFAAGIASSYYKESIGLAFGALGGMNIIGNPKEFILEIRTGVGRYDSGIVRGTGGLIRGVTAGTANAVSKIMGSLGNGIGSLSLDDHYLNERETIKQRQINGFMDGLSSSGLSIYKGFQCGLTGLVRQPLQGMKQDGATGAFKGLLKGVTGLVTKPLTGIIDATSKTAQGITVVSKLTKKQAFGDEWYHPLYFVRSIIRPYDDVDQMCVLYLRRFMPEQLPKMQLVKCFLLQSQDPNTLMQMLVINLQQTIQIDINQRKIILRVKNQRLQATAKFSEGVVLYYLEEKEQKDEEDDEEVELVLRLKRNNQLKHLLYLTLQKVIETFKSGQ